MQCAVIDGYRGFSPTRLISNLSNGIQLSVPLILPLIGAESLARKNLSLEVCP
jgi:hypothetical protein